MREYCRGKTVRRYDTPRDSDLPNPASKNTLVSLTQPQPFPPPSQSKRTSKGLGLVVIMVIVASSKYKIARSAPSEDSLCAGWVPFRENNGGLSDENGGFLHAQLGSGRAHTSASLHLSGILFYVSNQMSKVKPTTCLYRKS